jgi:hypothetical protein
LKEDVPWAWTLLQWIPTLELPSLSSSSFTKQCKRKSFSICLSLYNISLQLCFKWKPLNPPFLPSHQHLRALCSFFGFF